MGCSKCRDEFRFFKLGFTTHDQDRVHGCQWSFPGSHVLHVLWRFILFGYVVAWVVLVFLSNNDGWTSISELNNQTAGGNISQPSTNSTGTKQPIMVYLTIWSYLVLGAYLVWSFLVSLWLSCVSGDTDQDNGGSFIDRYTTKKKSWSIPANGAATGGGPRKESKELADFADLNEDKVEQELVSGLSIAPHATWWYMKLDWLLYAIISVVCPIITLTYFALLLPQINAVIPGYTVSAGDLNLHGITSVIILLDTIERAIPIRIVHVLYAMLYGLSYIIFSAIYWAFDHDNVLYPGVLDWNYPGWTIMMVSLLCFVALPIMQLLLFGLSELKLAIYRKTCLR